MHSPTDKMHCPNASGVILETTLLQPVLCNISKHARNSRHTRPEANYACIVNAGAGTNCRRWCQLLTLLTFGLFIWDGTAMSYVSAMQETCALCDENLYDHVVTQEQAAEVLQNSSDTSVSDGMWGRPCAGMPCSKDTLQYCLGSDFIKDHCWCERGHSKESIPFVPHICPLFEHYATVAESCFAYDELRKCCCAAALANKFAYLSSATHAWESGAGYLLGAMLLLLLLRHLQICI